MGAARLARLLRAERALAADRGGRRAGSGGPAAPVRILRGGDLCRRAHAKILVGLGRGGPGGGRPGGARRGTGRRGRGVDLGDPGSVRARDRGGGSAGRPGTEPRPEGPRAPAERAPGGRSGRSWGSSASSPARSTWPATRSCARARRPPGTAISRRRPTTRGPPARSSPGPPLRGSRRRSFRSPSNVRAASQTIERSHRALRRGLAHLARGHAAALARLETRKGASEALHRARALAPPSPALDTVLHPARHPLRSLRARSRN